VRYEAFRSIWCEALTKARLQSYLSLPTETVDLGRMSRLGRLNVHSGRSQEVEPFYASASSSWTWEARQLSPKAIAWADALELFIGAKVAAYPGDLGSGG
jgi:hypothetical protein